MEHRRETLREKRLRTEETLIELLEYVLLKRARCSSALLGTVRLPVLSIPLRQLVPNPEVGTGAALLARFLRPPTPKDSAPTAVLLARLELGALPPSMSSESSLVVALRRLEFLLRLRLLKLPALKREPKLDVGARSPFRVGVEGCPWSPSGTLAGIAGGDARLPGTLNKFLVFGAEATRLMNRVAAFGLFIDVCGVT